MNLADPNCFFFVFNLDFSGCYSFLEVKEQLTAVVVRWKAARHNLRGQKGNNVLNIQIFKIRYSDFKKLLVCVLQDFKVFISVIDCH